MFSIRMRFTNAVFIYCFPNPSTTDYNHALANQLCEWQRTSMNVPQKQNMLTLENKQKPIVCGCEVPTIETTSATCCIL